MQQIKEGRKEAKREARRKKLKMVEDIAKYYLSSVKMMVLFLGFFFNAICFLDFVLFC